MQQKTVIAANRFGLGARPGDLTLVEKNPEAWLLDQLQGPPRVPEDIRRLAHSAKVLVEVQDLRRRERRMSRAAAADPSEEFVRTYGRIARSHYVGQISARYRTAVASDFPFHERLVHFWSNHFAVSADKQPLPTIAGLFENEAIPTWPAISPTC